MPKSRCQQPNAKECKHDLSSNQHREKVMKYEKKKTKEESEYVTVPKQCKNHIDSYVPVVTSLLCYAFPT